jgi:membrane protein
LLTDYIQQYVLVDDNAVLSISGLITLFSASKAVTSLTRGLNAAYDVVETRSYPVTKIWGMFYTFLFTVIIIITMALPTVGIFILTKMGETIDIMLFDRIISLLSVVKNFVGPIIYILVFGSIYKYLPNKKLGIKDTWKGSLFAITMTTTASFLFSFVVNRFMNLSIIYGSLSTIIAFMLWLYLMALIVMIGAEINSIEYDNRISRSLKYETISEQMKIED